MTMRYTLIGLGAGAALAAGLWIYVFTASAQGGPGYGPGMMGGYGPGYHMGWDGPAGGRWNCPAFSQGDESGDGYGPGYHMRGWRGGFGPGMMRGYGYGRDGAQDNRNLNLTIDDAKARMERWLALRDNPRLKLGDVKEMDADSITADIVTKDNSLVDRLIIDRHTGFIRRDNG